MIRYKFLIYLLFFPMVAFAQVGIEHDVTILEDARVFEITSLSKAKLSVKTKIMIMNERGQEKLGYFSVSYDKFSRILLFNASVSDGLGNVIQRKLRDEDIKDFPAVDGISLANDDRVRVAFPRASQFPYIVECQYVVEYDGFLRIPAWYPQKPGASVERSEYTVITPRHFNLRYATRNLNITPAIEHGPTQSRYKWTVNNLAALRFEPMMPPIETLLPHLVIGADAFIYGTVPGKSATWSDFGQWYAHLSENRQNLSGNKIAYLQNLVRNAKTDVEKAKLVYDHLQSTTRYILVTLGLGGFQPFDAAYVETNQYGDCKALTNYLMAMLDAVGVKAYPALINAGEDEMDILEEVPGAQFNHVILALPQPNNEWIWLEATNQSYNFGHLGDFTENKTALIITLQGGILVKTPVNAAHQNETQNHIQAVLEESGKVTFDVVRSRKGNSKDAARDVYNSLSENERKRRLVESMDFTAPNLISADFSDINNRDDVFELKYKIEAQRYANKTGNRLFIKPNAFNRFNSMPETGADRKYIFDFGYAETVVDTVKITLPTGFTVEALPNAIKLSKPFADFEAMVIKKEDGNLLYTRRYVQKQRFIPRELASEVNTFYRSISTADQMMVVLKKL